MLLGPKHRRVARVSSHVTHHETAESGGSGAAPASAAGGVERGWSNNSNNNSHSGRMSGGLFSVPPQPPQRRRGDPYCRVLFFLGMSGMTVWMMQRYQNVSFRSTRGGVPARRGPPPALVQFRRNHAEWRSNVTRHWTQELVKQQEATPQVVSWDYGRTESMESSTYHLPFVELYAGTRSCRDMMQSAALWMPMKGVRARTRPRACIVYHSYVDLQKYIAEEKRAAEEYEDDDEFDGGDDEEEDDDDNDGGDNSKESNEADKETKKLIEAIKASGARDKQKHDTNRDEPKQRHRKLKSRKEEKKKESSPHYVLGRFVPLPKTRLEMTKEEEEEQQQQQQQTTAAAVAAGDASLAKKAALDWAVSLSDWDRVAVLTRRGVGEGHENNQDRAVVVYPYRIDTFQPPKGPAAAAAAQRNNALTTGEHDFFLGIFDGHGPDGHVISQFAAQSMHLILADKLSSQQDARVYGLAPPLDERGHSHEWDPRQVEAIVKHALVETFLQVHAVSPEVRYSGATASVALRFQSQLYVANTGDSRTVLVAYRRNEAEEWARVSTPYKSRQDKPHLPEERARIESKGGTVYIPQDLKVESSRTVFAVDDDDAGGAGDGLSNLMSLAMSRSIGDREMEDVGVIADPTVHVIDLQALSDRISQSPLKTKSSGTKPTEESNEEDYQVEFFVMAMTDGIFDELHIREVARRLAIALYSSSSSPQYASPLQACEDLIMDASQRWKVSMQGYGYRDDITIAVVKVT